MYTYIYNIRLSSGLNCDPDESFAAQVRREMQQKIGGLDVQGKVTAEATSTTLAAVAKVIESITQLHGAAVPHGYRQPDMQFKTKIELNQGGACIKYHDDFVDVRLVTTLVGDGTVLADNTEVDCSYYDKSGGHLPAGADDDSGRDFSDTVREWNARVVPSGELACAPGGGDVGVMKGGMLTKRPCLHRAPYSADSEAKKLPRFLVTVERLPADMVQEFYDMEQSMCDCSDCSDDEDTDSDSGDGEDSESNGGDADGKASERDTAE